MAKLSCTAMAAIQGPFASPIAHLAHSCRHHWSATRYVVTIPRLPCTVSRRRRCLRNLWINLTHATPPADDGAYQALWAHTSAEECATFEKFAGLSVDVVGRCPAGLGDRTDRVLDVLIDGEPEREAASPLPQRFRECVGRADGVGAQQHLCHARIIGVGSGAGG